jgi:hypothetical protein
MKDAIAKAIAVAVMVGAFGLVVVGAFGLGAGTARADCEFWCDNSGTC